MAGEAPPWRTAPRPLAVLLGCLAAACAPAGDSPFSGLSRCSSDSPFRRTLFGGVVNSEGNFRYDPTTTADDGGSPDPQLCPLYRQSLHPWSCRLRQAL